MMLPQAPRTPLSPFPMCSVCGVYVGEELKEACGLLPPHAFAVVL